MNDTPASRPSASGTIIPVWRTFVRLGNVVFRGKSAHTFRLAMQKYVFFSKFVNMSKKKSIIIGYQGIEGSFSEAAAMKMAELCGFTDVVYIPLKNSAPVINALFRKEIDYALVATRNSIGGNVAETMAVITRAQLRLKRAEVFPIHQCIFKANRSVKNQSIKKIISHVQALNQTRNYRENNFPIADAIEDEDTALAAKKLSEGVYGKDTAVICSHEAGTRYGLSLIEENIEDQKDNKTEFRLFALPLKKYVVHESFNDSLLKNGQVVELIIKGVIFVILLAALWFVTRVNKNPIAAAAALSGYIAAVYFAIKTLKSYFTTRSIVGYWKYYSKPDTVQNETQQYHIPRVVEIRHKEGRLHLDIYTPRGTIQAVSDEAYLYSPGSSWGQFTYKYHTPNNNNVDVEGFAILGWYRRNSLCRINKMTGNYFGRRTRDTGSFTFFRISKNEFEDIKNSRFLVSAN